ncbi:hypothetical protein FQN51_001808 [Onygenales sp. PD_10]|nr:hypothetical protein FQN51_001808 [Onygenales sp. PD_10]
MDLPGYKDTLSRLYIDENRTLSEVMTYMEKEYDIHAKKGVYQRLFAKWSFRKTKVGGNWIWVDHRIEKRKAAGKKRSALLVNGNPLDTKKVEKEISRHVSTTDRIQAIVATPETPDGFEIMTPAGSTPAQQTPSTPYSMLQADTTSEAGSVFNSSLNEEDMAEDRQLLTEVMEDCGSFISVWAAMGLPMSSKTALASYSSIAEQIIANTWNQDSSERLLPAMFFDILRSVYKNDQTHVQIQLNSLPNNTRKDIIRTAMFIASAKGCVNAAEPLFSQGVPVDSRDSKGQTCLHIAAHHNHPGMVLFLINRNATVDIRRRDGQTPWTLICSWAKFERVTNLLLEAGANKHILVNDGVSPLYRAAAGGHVDSHWAAKNGHFVVVKLLVEAGADVNCISDTFKTPLGLMGPEWPDIREYLERHGALLQLS